MRKALFFLLTLLTLGFAAQTVSAQTVWDGTADISWYDADQTSFDISTPEQLAGVAQLVNSGTSFNGKTLNLTADLWLNSTGDSTNNWVPIGGSATATSEAQSSGNSFRGVFNGHGHTIYNLYCEKTNYFHAGLFGCIQNPCTIDSLVMINPTVKSCGMMGAIAGMTRSGGQIYIRYCLVINANIVGTPSGTGPSASHNNIGGIVGANYPNTGGTYIQNCGVTGNISGFYIGGIGGNAQYDYITNCYFAGTLTPYNTNYGGMTAHDGTRTNCYSYTVVNGSQSQSSASNDGTSVTQAEMQDPQMIVNLGDAFKMDNGINNGYPVMSYMAGVDPIAAEICQGESITITAFGFDTYAWSNGSTSDVITVSPTTTTTYTVTCTANGVSTVLSSTITVHPQAVITATVAASSDGQVHATISPETTTVPCGSSDNVTFTVTPDEHWRVASVHMNGILLYDAQTYGPFSFTVNPGGTLANVVVHMTNALTCTNVLNLHASDIYGSNATISWNAHTTGELSEYHVIVRDLAAQSESEYTTTDLSYVIMGLTENTPYQVGVYTFCLDGYGSDTTFVNFMTPCNSPVNVTVGTGTSTTSYFPTYSCYNYSYTQQIYPASAIGSEPMDFSSIFFQCSSTTSNPTRTIDIYASQVPASMNLGSGWILPSTVPFQLVFSGTVNFSANGTDHWFEIPLDTLLPFNGTDNILLSILDHTGTYSCSNSFYYHNDATTSNMSRYVYRDASTYDINGPDAAGYSSSNIANIRFVFCDESTCIRPNTVTASNVTESSADIAWVTVGSESSWEVEYKAAADTEWTSAGTVSSAEAYLTGLNGNTQYSVRVRALCGGSDMSLWTDVISFRTECASITQLPFSEDFEDASAIYSTSQDNYILCWDRYASNSSHYVYIPSNTYAHSGTHFLDFHHTDGCFDIAIMPAVDESISISDLMVSFYACRTGSSGTLEVGVMSDKTNPTTFVAMDTINLSSYNTYEYGLQQVSFENYTDNGRYIAFRVSNGVSCGFYVDDVLLEERPMCLYPTNFHAVNVSNEEVTLGWTEPGNATAWNILYDVTGFDPETEGTTVSADANPYTVTGLTNVTTYDFYVQADCGGITSDWVGPLTLKTGVYNMGVTGSDTLTTCGSYIYDDGGPDGNHSTSCDYTLVIYPATPGSGLSLSGTVNLYDASSYYQGFLRIYEGVGTTGNLLGEFSGTQTVNVACGGPVTLRLTTGSYSYYNYAGFEILAQCTECFPPSNLAVSNQTLDGATVTWSGNADSYAVYLSGAMTGYYTTNDTTYTFTGLNGSSTYSVQVRALCGTDSSLLSQTAHFNTACAPITVTADNPWFEDFEGYTGGGAQSFVCWETPVTEVVDNGTSPFVYCGHSPSCHSGANSAELKGSNNMLALPEFSNDIHDLRLTFWATTTNTSNYGTVEVGVITDINDPTTFVALGPAGTPGPRGGSGSGHGNFMGPFDFNGVTATTGRIAIKFTGYSGLSWNLDDFTVSLAPNCPSPVKTSVQASNIDGHNATITFTDNDTDHNSWTVYYKPSSDSVWNSVVTNTTSADLNNLDPETQYDVYVVTNCATPDATEDATLTIHFTTLVACPAPQNVTVSNIGMTSATLTWFSNADSFTIEYGEAGFTPGTGTVVTTSTTTYDLTGLTAGTAYTVIITADCGVDGTSAAATQNFNTALCEVTDQCGYTFEMHDSFGDGWNGGSITVQQNGVTVATLGMTSGSSNTLVVTLCDLQSTTLIWNTGSYDSEVSFVVYDPNDEVVYNASSVSAGTLTTFTTNCTPPTCPKPVSVSVSSISDNSADVSWIPGGNETAWNLEYKANTEATWTVVPVTTTSYTLTNLSPSTNYNVRVQADCGGGDVSDYRETSFVTACGVISTFPYDEGFENGGLGCWVNESVVGDNPWTYYSYSGNTGTASVHMSYTDNTMSRLVSPIFDLTGLTSPKVSFYYSIGDYLGTADTFAVYYRTAASDSWVRISGYNQSTSGYMMDSLDLPTPSATYQISFLGYGIDGLGMYLDDIQIYDGSGSGPGPVVTDPTVATNAAENIEQTTATLKATITNPDNVTITAKGFQWKATTGGTYTQIAGTGTGNTFTANLTNLTPNTSYTYKAFITFNGTTVEGSEMTFTTQPEDTPEPCETPTNLHASTCDAHSITIGWNANGNATSWNIRYRVENGSWSSATSNTNSYVISGLVAETLYEIQVQANCGNGNLSDWCEPIHISTTYDGIDSWLENSVNLYPNPAREVVNVQCTMNNVQLTGELSVFDVYGKLLQIVPITSEITPINVSGLANGMYFVRVTTEAGSVTKTFVKKG